MRSYIPKFELKTLSSLSKTLDLIQSERGIWRPFAGGTDLMVLFEAGLLSHSHYLNLLKFKELKLIEVKKEFIRIGACITYSQIQRHSILQKEFPLLCKAARVTGSVAIQNRGTLGGNIANGSPAADSPPALLVYEAELELLSSAGVRRVPYSVFHTGYKKNQLKADEIISAIFLPRSKEKWSGFYRKVGTRKAQAISKVCLAAQIKWKDKKIIQRICIGAGSVAPTPIRCLKTEDFLQGQKIQKMNWDELEHILTTDIAPINDLRSNAHYRQHVTMALLKQALLQNGRTS